MDCSPAGSSVHGILQATTLEQVAISSSRGTSWHRDWTHVAESPALGGRFFTTAPPGKPIYVKPQWIRWFHTAAKSWNQQGLESFTAVGQNAGDVVLVRLSRFLCKWRQLFYLRWWESLLGVSVWREENRQEYPQLLNGVQLHPKGPLKTAVYGTKFVRSTDQHLPDPDWPWKLFSEWLADWITIGKCAWIHRPNNSFGNRSHLKMSLNSSWAGKDWMWL